MTVEELEARLAEAEEEADKYSRLQQALGDLVCVVRRVPTVVCACG